MVKIKDISIFKNLKIFFPLYVPTKLILEISLPVCIYFFSDLEGRLYKHIISRGVNFEFMYLTKRLGSTNKIFRVFLGYILYPDFVFIRSNFFMFFYIRCVQIVKQKCSRGFWCHIYAFRKKFDRSV